MLLPLRERVVSRLVALLGLAMVLASAEVAEAAPNAAGDTRVDACWTQADAAADRARAEGGHSWQQVAELAYAACLGKPLGLIMVQDAETDCQRRAALHYAIAESLGLDADAAWEDAMMAPECAWEQP